MSRSSTAQGTAALPESHSGADRVATCEWPNQRVEWIRVIPFFLLHAACLLVFWVGWSWTALVIAGLVYAVRVFGLTAFYHRYFSHRAFKTSRWFQFVGALLGNAAAQRGPIWWAAHHRHHHRHADETIDIHSPARHGLIWSHLLWFMTRENYHSERRGVKDLIKFPELRFLDRFDLVAPVGLAFGLYGLGVILDVYAPGLGVTGGQLVIWGFIVSTIVLYHVTYSINSLAHRFGTRRYETRDSSRNNFWLAIITFGEGWHNNHHHYPASARQGFYWWEWDVTYYVLVVLSWFGLVWDLKPVPQAILEDGRRHLADEDAPPAAPSGSEL